MRGNENNFKKVVLDIAKKSIVNFVKNKKEIEIDLNSLPKQFSELKGVFVSIYKNNNLRGCIGFPYPIYPLAIAISKAAKEACKDPRFEELKEAELKDIKIEVSILGEMKRIDNKVKNRIDILNILDKNKGYMIVKGFQSALFLPQVWKIIKDKKEFLENLCLKAGLRKDCWLDEETEIYEFEAEIFEE
ncbi:MAG: AmmeMemoRadiSam system protein A [Candidatus Aenigmatarchaeota archaeon]|nr:AmmeMemoRadiSam system protein A [Candidatus Aenigmarchaeota archaeon]